LRRVVRVGLEIEDMSITLRKVRHTENIKDLWRKGNRAKRAAQCGNEGKNKSWQGEGTWSWVGELRPGRGKQRTRKVFRMKIGRERMIVKG